MVVCIAKGLGSLQSLWGGSGIPPDIEYKEGWAVWSVDLSTKRNTMAPLSFFVEAYRNSRGSTVGGVMHVSIQWEQAFWFSVALPHTLSYFHCMPIYWATSLLCCKKDFVLRMLCGGPSITGFLVWVLHRYKLRLYSVKLIKCLCNV
jgi:hypothetical protein